MRILKFSNAEERKTFIDLCKNLIAKELLVPCIGAGFSKGVKTETKTIPDAKTLMNDLMQLLKTHDTKTTEEDINDVSNSFFELADYFWKRYRENLILQEEFISYSAMHFMGAMDIPPAQIAFLNSGWKSLFSLNYDDVIEKATSSFIRILPYQGQNDYYLKEKNCLYKLHGDINRFLETGDPHYFIMGKMQYIEMIRDDRNRTMLNKLSLFSLSKSFLFIGCSLKEELDLLYTSELGLQEKCKDINKDIQAHICVHYQENAPGKEIKILSTQEAKYESYGITDLILVSSQEEMNELYYEIAECHKQKNQISSSKISRFADLKISVLDRTSKENISYLFNNGMLLRHFDSKDIILPSFAISRKTDKNIIKSINENTANIYILYGRFFSGKTICLLNVLRAFPTRKVFYFPSFCRLSDDSIDEICNANNAIFLFDSNSIEKHQIKKLCQQAAALLKEKNLFFIFTTSPSDGKFYKDIMVKNFLLEDSSVKLVEIKSRFDAEESQLFNDAIGALSLLPYDSHMTFFDYLMQLEKVLGDSTAIIFQSPPINFIGRDDSARLKAIIMLATEDVIPASRALSFQIDKALSNISEITSYTMSVNSGDVRGALVERDYFLPTSTQDSGFSYVHNSKFWLMLVLQNFAMHNAYDIVANAYFEIINDLQYEYSQSSNRFWMQIFFNKSKSYYLFDTIQSIFIHPQHGGWLLMIENIYNKLTPVMNQSFQFLHQKTKCELRVARSKTSISPRQYLHEAILNITRAITLATKEKDIDNDIEISLAHMFFTKMLVDINCVLKLNERIEETIDMLHDYYVRKKYNNYAPLNQTEDINDIKTFMNGLMRSTIVFPNEKKNAVNELSTFYFQR